MSIIQWITGTLPESVLPIIYFTAIVLGISGIAAGWLGRWIPVYGQYASILKPIGVVLIIVGVYLKGSYDCEVHWREKVKQAEERAKLAEQKAQQVNTKVVKEYEEKIKVVKENVIVYKDRIKEVEKVIDADCKIPPEAIEIHNNAALNTATESIK